MSAWMIAFIGAQYLAIACMALAKGRVDMVLLFGGYAIAQVGVWMAAR